MAPPAVEVRCAGCGETLEVDHGTTEFACPGCATAQYLPPELMPPPPRPRRAIPLSPAGAAQDRVPCGGCGAVLSVPPGFKSFGCPVCGGAARRPQASSRPDRLPAAHPVPPGQEVLEDPLSQATHSGLVHVEREPPNQAAHEQQAHGTSSDRVVHADQVQVEPGRKDQVQVEPGRKTAAWNQKRKRSSQSAAGKATMSMFQQDVYQIIHAKKKFANHRFVKWSYLRQNPAYNGLYRLFRNVRLDSLVSLRCNFHAKTIRQFYATVYVSPDHNHLKWMTGQQMLEASKDDFLNALSLGDSSGIKVHLQKPLALTQTDEFYDHGNHFTRGKVTGLLPLPSIINRIMRASFFPRSGNNDEIHGRAWNVVKYIMDGTRIDVMDLMIREIATSKGDKDKSIYFAPYIMKLIQSKIDFNDPYDIEHKEYRPRDAPPQVPPPPPQPQGQGLPSQEHSGQQAPQEQDPIMAALSRLQSSVDRMDIRFDQMHAVQVETRAMVEGLNVRFDGMDSKVTHLDERLTEYQQQRVPLAYQRFGRGQRPPSFTQCGDHPSSSEAPPSS